MWLTFQVYTQELVTSDNFKTRKEKYLDKKTLESEELEVYIGRIPVMVILDAAIVTNWLTRAFSMGSWSHSFKNWETTSGVVALVRRANPLQMISNMRRTRQQVLYAGKAGYARYP